MKISTQQSGFTLIFTIMVIATLGALIIGLYSLSTVLYGTTGRLVDLAQARALAQGGIDRAVHKLSYDQTYTGETNLSIPPVAGVLDIVVTAPTQSTRLIKTTAYVPNKSFPAITYKVSAKGVTTTAAQGNVFTYALQTGQGGFYATQNVKIDGSIYSNENIQIDGTGSDVTGDASAVGTVHTNGKIDGTIYSPVSSAPMTNVDFAAWQDKATNHGTTVAGDLLVNSNADLTLGGDGNISVINGKLTISSNPKITLAGPIWVKGSGDSSIEITGNPTFTIPSTYNSMTTAIVADQKISIGGNTNFNTDKTNARMMIASQYPGTITPDTTAIEITSNAQFNAAALYAPNGKLTISTSSSNLKAIALEAQKLQIDSNAQITYDQGLASYYFNQPNAPTGGGFVMTPGSYSVLSP